MRIFSCKSLKHIDFFDFSALAHFKNSSAFVFTYRQKERRSNRRGMEAGEVQKPNHGSEMLIK